jgi:hypothetical protein
LDLCLTFQRARLEQAVVDTVALVQYKASTAYVAENCRYPTLSPDLGQMAEDVPVDVLKAWVEQLPLCELEVAQVVNRVCS